MVYTFNSSTREADLHVFELSLVYKVGSGYPGLLHRETLTRKTNQNDNNKNPKIQKQTKAHEVGKMW